MPEPMPSTDGCPIKLGSDVLEVTKLSPHIGMGGSKVKLLIPNLFHAHEKNRSIEVWFGQSKCRILSVDENIVIVKAPSLHEFQQNNNSRRIAQVRVLKPRYGYIRMSENCTFQYSTGLIDIIPKSGSIRGGTPWPFLPL